jgi:hypothetical protein
MAGSSPSCLRAVPCIRAARARCGHAWALLILFLLPLLWLLSLPFRALGVVVEALFAFIKAVLFLPARLLGYRG